MAIGAAADGGRVPSSRSSFSKCFRAFLIFTRVAAEAARSKYTKTQTVKILPLFYLGVFYIVKSHLISAKIITTHY